jgi:hypothetical protein
MLYEYYQQVGKTQFVIVPNQLLANLAEAMADRHLHT